MVRERGRCHYGTLERPRYHPVPSGPKEEGEEVTEEAHPLTQDILQTLNNALTIAYLRGDIEYGEYIRARFWHSDQVEKVKK